MHNFVLLRLNRNHPDAQALLHVETQPFLKGIAINADKAAAQGVPSRPAEK